MAPNDLTKADWLPPARPAEDTNPSPVSRPKYVVASFHTHSPWKFVDALGGIVASRPVGGHDADAAADKNENVVGIVYDYVGTPDEFSDKNQILEGHPLDAPAKLYHSPGTSRILP